MHLSFLLKPVGFNRFSEFIFRHIERSIDRNTPDGEFWLLPLKGHKILLDILFVVDYSADGEFKRMIDGTDKAILNILQRDGRTSNAEIARQVNLAPSAVLERIRKLEERKIIRGYSADIDSKALDYGLTSIIAVRTVDDLTGIGEQLAAVPEIQEVHEVAGDDCFYIKVLSKDAESLGLFLREKIKAIPNVVNTRTVVVLKTFKEGTLVPIEPEELKRARGK